MLTKEEQEILSQILKEGAKREKNRLYCYSLYIAISITILIGIVALIIGFIFKAYSMIILGSFMVGMGLYAIIISRRNKILYHAIKKIVPAMEFSSLNNSLKRKVVVVTGLIFIIGGLIAAFEYELRYELLKLMGLKTLLQKTPIDIRITGFGMVTAGFLIIFIPTGVKKMARLIKANNKKVEAASETSSLKG